MHSVLDRLQNNKPLACMNVMYFTEKHPTSYAQGTESIGSRNLSWRKCVCERERGRGMEDDSLGEGLGGRFRTDDENR